jgi:protein transport protein SEC24
VWSDERAGKGPHRLVWLVRRGSTLAAVPATDKLRKQTGLPFAIHIHPFAEDQKIPVIDNLCITRCSLCRTYINPFASFVQNGLKWRCNLCSRVNPMPSDFDVDRVTNGSVDRRTRGDLNSASVEYIAPSEYMVRAPQPCTYVFVVDVTAASLSSGMVQTVCDTLRASLDKLTGDSRTRVALITFDETIHFFNLKVHASMTDLFLWGVGEGAAA